MKHHRQISFFQACSSNISMIFATSREFANNTLSICYLATKTPSYSFLKGILRYICNFSCTKPQYWQDYRLFMSQLLHTKTYNSSWGIHTCIFAISRMHILIQARDTWKVMCQLMGLIIKKLVSSTQLHLYK